MEKKLKKLLAMSLSLSMLLNCFAVPMSASAEAPAGETYETATEILFTELKDAGSYLSGEKSMGVGSKAFTFDADTYSNVVKLRWKAGVTATNEFKVSFDESGDQISDPFGFGVKASDGATSIDTIVFQNGLNTATKKLDAPIEKDDEHDIELGRLKVLTGDNEGKYYVYLKFDNELIGSAYVSVDENNQYTASGSPVTMAHSIRFVTYGRGGADIIKEMYVPESYEVANEILFTELKDGGAYLSGEKSMGTGSKAFTFDADTYSNVVKLRWKAGVTATNEFKVSFDESGDQISDPFGFGIKASDGVSSIDTIVFQNGLNTASKKLDAPIEKDDEHDIELGRIRVLTGVNEGKYYVYLKFDNELIGEAYVSVDGNKQYTASGSTVTMAHSIRFVTYGRGGADVIKEMYVPETRESATEIGFTDLIDEGTHLSGEKSMGTGSKAFTFEADTYSNVVKLRWKAGVTATNEFKVSFDEVGDQISDPFGFSVKASDGATCIDTVVFQNGLNTATKKLDAPILAGDEHNIELGRQKVLTGTNEGKYYVYLKFDDELIGSAYVSVDRNNQYTASGSTVTMAHSIRFVTYGRGGADVIKEMYVAETYETATEIGFTDLMDEGTHLSGEKSMGVGSKAFTFDADSYSNVVKLRWKAGVTATNEFKVSFDEVGDQISDPFGFSVKASDGATCIDTVVFQNGLNTATKKLDAPILAGDEHNIELGRQKVLTGTNEDKYYVYLKFDDELIGSAYVSVDENNQYTASDSTVTMMHSIRFVTYGRGGADIIKALYVPETLETATEIGFTDLMDEGTHLSGEKSMGVGSKAFTFDADSYSNVVKLRWKAGVTATNEFKVSFDEVGDQISDPFGFSVKASDGATCIDTVVFQNGLNTATKTLAAPIEAGNEHNIELGRQKVLTGTNEGKYYVYLKFDDELIGSAYVSVDENNQYTASDSTVTMMHSIRFVTYGRGGADIIKALYVPETLETPTEIGFTDLMDEGTHLSGEKSMGVGSKEFTFEADTYSNVVKLCWKAGVTATNEFKVSFDKNGDQISDPFGFAVKASDGATCIDTVVFQNGLSTATKTLVAPIEAGNEHNIELGRQKVLTGTNEGKYYVYLKFDDELIGSAYVSVDENNQYTASDSTVTMMHSIRFVTYGRGGADIIKALYVPETYEAYDEIGYADLKENGDALGNQREFSNSSAVLTYDQTSPTGSAIFKYRWKVGDIAKFQLSFDKYFDADNNVNVMSYMFGAWLEPNDSYPNGRMWLRPSFGPEKNLPTALATGSSHNVEFARLKVKTGTNTGKYYVYIKIDNVLIAESYVDANVVDSNGNYTSNSGKAYTISNEILFTFWGSYDNIISPYRELNANEHEGTSGDFDNDGIINEGDIALIRKIIAGEIDINELPAEIADINKDGKVDSRDIVVMKKDLLAGNTYEKSRSLLLGMQEHLLEDATKTAEYIADASATLGAGAYRLSKPIQSLYYVTTSNGVEVKADAMEEFKAMVAALKAKGINEILYVTDAFILPYGYNNAEINHNKTVPDPITDPENYEAWLTVNAAAFKALAKEVPEIKYFEPFNEINVLGCRLETPGIGWDASEAEQIAHRYTVQEKAGIMADLCWYISRAVKSVEATNQVTTPSLSVEIQSNVEDTFLDEFYKVIESGACPTGKAVADKRIDNYFTIINLHGYPDYDSDWLGRYQQDKVDDLADKINASYVVAKNHNDGNSRVWLTETGMASCEPDGEERNADRIANMIKLVLDKIDSELTFIDTVFMYKVADISSDIETVSNESYYGLFYSGDDFDYPYQAKPIAETVYSFFHNGSSDYSAIEELVRRYNGN